MSQKELIVIGGSAGSFDALKQILSHLPKNYPLAMIVVLHQHRHSGTHLASLFETKCEIPVKAIVDKEAILPGTVYVCPANYHVLVTEERLFALSVDPPVNNARPSIDVLFESAASVYRDHVVGVLLSGASQDGAKGLNLIRNCGGSSLCQDAGTAQEPTMPKAGCETDGKGWIGSPDAIGIELSRLKDERN